MSYKIYKIYKNLWIKGLECTFNQIPISQKHVEYGIK